MKFGNSEDIRLLVVDGLDSSSSFSPSSSSSSMCLCRICHEEEEENSTSMESPCACSGTLKFAHRVCIQRWCDEKGSSVCEICLQKFEQGYTVPPKLALIDIAVTIRGSLEVPRLNYASQNPELTVITANDESDYDYPECSPTSDRGTAWCRAVALIFTLILLARHLIAVVSAGAGHYPFTLATVFVLRATGILLPVYFILRMITAIQNGQRQHRLHRRNGVEEDDELQQHTL